MIFQQGLSCATNTCSSFCILPVDWTRLHRSPESRFGCSRMMRVHSPCTRAVSLPRLPLERLRLPGSLPLYLLFPIQPLPDLVHLLIGYPVCTCAKNCVGPGWEIYGKTDFEAVQAPAPRSWLCPLPAHIGPHCSTSLSCSLCLIRLRIQAPTRP